MHQSELEIIEKLVESGHKISQGGIYVCKMRYPSDQPVYESILKGFPAEFHCLKTAVHAYKNALAEANEKFSKIS